MSGCPSCLLFASASRKPPQIFFFFEFQGLLSLFHFEIGEITDLSASLTLHVTLSRQASLLAGPRFPHPFNGASSPCLHGNRFQVLSRCGPRGVGRGSWQAKAQRCSPEQTTEAALLFKSQLFWGLKIGPNGRAVKAPDENLLGSLPSRPMPPCGVRGLALWALPAGVRRRGEVKGGSLPLPSTMAEGTSGAPHPRPVHPTV